MSLVIDFSSIDGTMLAVVGGKAANLGELTGAGLPELMTTTGIDENRMRELARDTLRIQAYVRQRFGATATLADADVGQWLRDARKRATVVDPGGISGSRLGFKGSEELGNGLKAVYVLEFGSLKNDIDQVGTLRCSGTIRMSSSMTKGRSWCMTELGQRCEPSKGL